jgi:6-pyruvoyltetrahydropterin/6-carboxytetrahydropterin synthase
MERVALDNDIKYIDRAGNLFRTRAELSISKMLSFLGQNFEYDVMLKFKNDDIVNVDFKIDDKYIEVIDCENDVNKFLRIRRELPEIKIIAVGHSKYAGKVNELDSFFFFNSNYSQTGSIFIEDPSLAFDYAHILPLVEKCSILHGHTSTVMVEIIGDMKNNLIIDFGEAKRINYS